jgi:hypothetical protein
MFQRGDFVRLNRGWTFMVVLNVDHRTGELTAKYASKWAPSMSDFHQPQYADGCQRRHYTGFSRWDGAIPKHMKDFPMPTSTKYLTSDGREGYFVNNAGSDSVVLNMGDAQNEKLELFGRSSLTEILPYTFSVKAVGSNYKCHYEAPVMKKPITVGDMLLSDSGNLYVVQKINTQYRHPKAVFKGRRVKLTDI